jgi:hypothetical protein
MRRRVGHQAFAGKLRLPSSTLIAPDVNHRIDAGRSKERDELFDCPCAVPDGSDRLALSLHRVVPLALFSAEPAPVPKTAPAASSGRAREGSIAGELFGADVLIGDANVNEHCPQRPHKTGRPGQVVDRLRLAIEEIDRRADALKVAAQQ